MAVPGTALDERFRRIKDMLELVKVRRDVFRTRVPSTFDGTRTVRPTDDEQTSEDFETVCDGIPIKTVLNLIRSRIIGVDDVDFRSLVTESEILAWMDSLP